MDVILFCFVLLGLAAFVAAPLYRPASSHTIEAELGVTAVAVNDAAAAALSDLEVDRASGLIDESTYATQRAALLADVRDTAEPEGSSAD